MGTAIRGSLLLWFLRTNSQPGMREGSDPLALSHGDCNSWLLLLSFLLTNSQSGNARGFRPSRALPWGPRFAAPASFVSSHELAAGDARGFRPSRALPWDWDSRLLLLSFLLTNSQPGDARGFRPSRALPWGCDSRLLLLSFLRTNSPPGMREGSDPLALSRGGRDSQLSTSFASPFVSPYSSGMRTVSDWGGTVTAVDSFLGCAESRFAERKSVRVTASGRVTRISRSAERLYTR